MNKKIFTAVIALSVVAGSAFAQTKQLSAPTKTETTTAPNTTTKAPGNDESAQSQNSEVKPTPQTVTPSEAVATKFKTMYPEVKEVKWIKNKQSNFVAQFKNNATESRAVFTPEGAVVRLVSVIQKSTLPTGVNAYLDKNFVGKTPKRCEEIKNGKGAVVYIIKYDDKVIRLDAKGNEVKPSEDMDESK